jgi:hypothetical protein
MMRGGLFHRREDSPLLGDLTGGLDLPGNPLRHGPPRPAERQDPWRKDALIRTFGLCLAVWVLLWAVPFQYYWYGLELLNVYRWWPVLVLAAAVHYWWHGYSAHRNTGVSLHSPVFGWLAVFAVLLVFCFLLNVWAADRSLGWVAATCAVGVLASYLLVSALFAYTGVWRRWNDQIVKRVHSDLTTGKFHAQTKRRLQAPHHLLPLPGPAADWLLPAAVRESLGALEIRVARLLKLEVRKQWGSVHCLAIVALYYAETKLAAMGQIEADQATDKLIAFLKAGESLADYLLLAWPGEVLDEATRDRWIAEIRRETTTLALWFAARPHFADRGKIAQVRGWLSNTYVPKSSANYRSFLDGMFRLAWDGLAGVVPSDPVQLIGRTLKTFEAITGDEPLWPGMDLREIAATTWLALTAALPDQMRLDVWFAMRRIQGADPLIVSRLPEATDGGRVLPMPLAEQAAGDPSARCARQALHELCARWRQRVPPEWSAGLAGLLADLGDSRPVPQSEAIVRRLQSASRKR